MRSRDGQVYPQGAGAGCVGLAIHQPGWAVAFSLDRRVKITYDQCVVLRKVSTFLGNSILHRQRYIDKNFAFKNQMNFNQP